MSLGDLRIAIVHDELTRRGGAEVVLEELLRAFPDAAVYALYAGKRPTLVVDGRTYSITASPLQRWPRWFRRHPSRLLPFLAQAAEQFDLSEYDVVVSSASAFAKAVVTRANVPHVCYCHTPTRYLWEAGAMPQAAPSLVRWPARALLHYLRLSDFTAAQRVDYFVANSHYTAERIHKYYRRKSEVVYPPVDTVFYTPQPQRAASQSRPFLCVGRLTASKRFDQAIAACEKMQLPLCIVGSGSAAQRLAKQAGRYTRILGRVSDSRLRELYRTSRALLQPGAEDFGLAAAEAQACGLPVIAFAVGGAAEIVRHAETGWLYRHQRVEALAEAIRRFIEIEHEFSQETLQRGVLKFSRSRFQSRMRAIVQRACAPTAH